MARVLVGVDGSKAAEAALRWASRYARATGEELVALHSFRRPYSEIAPDDLATLRDRRQELVAQEWVRPAIDLHAQVRVVDGDPRTALIDAVADDDIGLVVVGRTGAGGGPGFLHLGSVVEHAAHHLDVPLAVIPTGDDGRIERIVVGVDGSKESLAAVEWTARAAPALGAEVVAVVVEEPVAEWTPSWDEHNWRRDAERSMAAWVEPLRSADVPVTVVAAERLHPVDGLLGVSANRRADLLVIGTRGAGGFSGLRFGGVALKVLHRAALPLVLVPPWS